jgi:hypothetical protein
MFNDSKLDCYAKYLKSGTFPKVIKNNNKTGEKLKVDFRLYIGPIEEQTNILINGEVKKISDVSSLIGQPKEKNIYVDIEI